MESRDTSDMVPTAGRYSAHLQKGKIYCVCICGRSRRQPFCDGSHGSSGLRPKIFKPEETQEYTFCGCKFTECSMASCDKTYLHLDW